MSIEIQHRKTKVVKNVTKEAFEQINKNPLTSGKWFEVEKAKVPPEVAKLEERKATAKTETPKNSVEKGENKN